MAGRRGAGRWQWQEVVCAGAGRCSDAVGRQVAGSGAERCRCVLVTRGKSEPPPPRRGLTVPSMENSHRISPFLFFFLLHLEDLAASLACHFHAIGACAGTGAVLEGWGWVGWREGVGGAWQPQCIPAADCASFGENALLLLYPNVHFYTFPNDQEYVLGISKASFIFFTSLRRKE